MSRGEHQELVRREDRGHVLIGVDRVAARKFFTDSSHRKVQAVIGESLYLDRFIVKSSFVLGYVLVLLGLAASVWAFNWWAVLVLPVTIAAWSWYLAASSRGNAGVGFGLVALIAAGAAYFLTPLSAPVKICFLLLAGALFFARFTYTSSTFLLRALALRNHKAFGALEGESLVVRQVA
jgi:hypothetical protein